MKKILLFFTFFSSLILIAFVFCFKIFANIDDQINQVTQQLNSLKEELSKKEANYSQLSIRLEQIKTRLNQLENDILQKEKDLKKSEEVLLYQKTLLNERVKSYYKNINKNTLNLINIFISDSLSLSLRDFFYQKSLIDEDRKTIIKIVLYIKNLEEQKAKLEEEKNRLSGLKKEVDEQSRVLSGQISETRQKIVQLSALQQKLIAQKLASLNISRSAASISRCDSDLTNGRDPGFSPKFAFFTYGVPNRVGLNQWGAYGRAKNGQNEEQILRAYYNFDSLENVDTNIKINVEGYGEFSLEDYVKRIYEVPDSWGSDGFAALKAQAIAARSYALAYTGGGVRSICPTEQCQVFKPDPKGGFWEQAVNETAGKVMKKDGQVIKAWYSSTHGGYVFKSSEIGWADTSWTKHGNDFEGVVGSFSELQDRAYDKDSPWFYCDWGWRVEYNRTAWLKPEEVADIINVLLLVKIDSSVAEHLYQEDKPNPSGKENWDKNKVKEELRKRGRTPFNLIYDGSVNADFGYGRTMAINFNGDAGSVSFDGKEFKDWFNLRAPANIQIVGLLYNIEKR